MLPREENPPRRARNTVHVVPYDLFHAVGSVRNLRYSISLQCSASVGLLQRVRLHQRQDLDQLRWDQQHHHRGHRGLRPSLRMESTPVCREEGFDIPCIPFATIVSFNFLSIEDCP